MSRVIPDLAVLLAQDEGQYFDRKSLWEGPPEVTRPRDRRTVRDEIAEYVAAFANAEGGALVLGVEDDGTPRPSRVVPLIDQVHRLTHLWGTDEVLMVDEHLDLPEIIMKLGNHLKERGVQVDSDQKERFEP